MWRVCVVTENGNEYVLSKSYETRKDADAALEEEMGWPVSFIEGSQIVGGHVEKE